MRCTPGGGCGIAATKPYDGQAASIGNGVMVAIEARDSAQVDQLYTYDVNATGDPVPTYTLTISQTGMTLDSLTGLISWTPTASQTGSFPVQVQAINTEGVDTQDFTIQVFDGPILIYLPIVLK